MHLINVPAEWNCDLCGGRVGTDDGFVAFENNADLSQIWHFRIYHAQPCLERVHALAHFRRTRTPASLPLRAFRGQDAASSILSLLAPLQGPSPESGTLIVPPCSIAGWVHVARRLLVADYEVAYPHFAQARADGMAGDPDQLVDRNTLDLIVQNYVTRE